MFETLRLLKVVSRPEFLPANCGSLMMGLAWSINPSSDLTPQLAILTALSFAIITVVSAIGAQLNTLSDHELDSNEPRKQYLVQATNALGKPKIKSVIAVEFMICLALIVPFLLIQVKPVLLLLLTVAMFLTYAYNVPPLRFKSRSWLDMLTLLLVLSILPVTFVYHSITSELNFVFLLFLAGQAVTVYAIIIPTETRDYFSDKANGVNTLTVRIGLVKASLLAMLMLSLGGALMVTAFMLTLANKHPILSLFLLTIVAADFIVLRNYKRLYSLSKAYASTKESLTAEGIVQLSANNPKWITLVSQSIVFMSIILLVAKFLP